MDDMFGSVFLWNPVGVRYIPSIQTQCALHDTGLWSGTALQFILEEGLYAPIALRPFGKSGHKAPPTIGLASPLF